MANYLDNRTPCILGEWLVLSEEMFFSSGLYYHGGWGEFVDIENLQKVCDNIIRSMVYD